ncbi:hypothetical protein [Cellulomonas wangleii]|uniref:hypothetical protein n=1 Tax=Cellulomonas wangleii TaxID=2816956 RepID=UPI001FB443F4|nr:hypothetical protein [Cellulomonas wangleii]
METPPDAGARPPGTTDGTPRTTPSVGVPVGDYRFAWPGVTQRSTRDADAAQTQTGRASTGGPGRSVRRLPGRRSAAVVGALACSLAIAGVTAAWSANRTQQSPAAPTPASTTADAPGTSAAVLAAVESLAQEREATSAAVVEAEQVWASSEGLVDEAQRGRLRTAIDAATRATGEAAGTPRERAGSMTRSLRTARLALVAVTATVRSAQTATPTEPAQEPPAPDVATGGGRPASGPEGAPTVEGGSDPAAGTPGAPQPPATHSPEPSAPVEPPPQTPGPETPSEPTPGTDPGTGGQDPGTGGQDPGTGDPGVPSAGE